MERRQWTIRAGPARSAPPQPPEVSRAAGLGPPRCSDEARCRRTTYAHAAKRLLEGALVSIREVEPARHELRAAHPGRHADGGVAEGTGRHLHGSRSTGWVNGTCCRLPDLGRPTGAARDRRPSCRAPGQHARALLGSAWPSAHRSAKSSTRAQHLPSAPPSRARAWRTHATAARTMSSSGTVR